jgi:UDP-N-acetylglucosamine 2-epimerase
MISIFYGTRPEYIKLYKLYTEMKIANFDCELVKVNQHTTLIEDCSFFEKGCFFLNAAAVSYNKLGLF